MISDTESSVIYDLESLPPGTGGGKAIGLAKLIRSGLNVPSGFVIVNPRQLDNDELLAAYKSIGKGTVAVRSSGTLEDGKLFSFAGQYETILNISSSVDLISAISQCLFSSESGRVEEYKENMAISGPSGMNIIVQKMVEASAAGVVFTADPISGDRGHLILEAVKGTGNALVDGKSSGSNYKISKEGLYIASTTGPDILSHEHIQELCRHAIKMENISGGSLDMEWAMDKDGTVYWLQMRPITTLDGPAINELDYNPNSENQFFTKANIGEMMPGAVTPLTIDVFGNAIDYCIRYFYRSTGSLVGKNKKERFVVNFSNHLFFNLDLFFTMAGRVLGSSQESIQQNLLGRVLDESPKIPIAPFPIRFFNLLRMFLYLLKRKSFIRNLEKATRDFSIKTDTCDPRELYQRIDMGIPMINWAYKWHLCPSTHSGVMNTVLLQVLNKAGCPDDELDSMLAVLLSGIEGIESADVIHRLEEIASIIRNDAIQADWFIRTAISDLIPWLIGADSGLCGEKFRELLLIHGHRCIREAEFREKEWNENPSPLIETLKNLIGIQKQPDFSDKEDPTESVLRKYPGTNRRAFNWLLRQSRLGVWSREYSKSIVISIQNRVKKAYRKLSALMFEQGLLPDEDLIYFFTHREIGEYLENPDPKTTLWMQKRRRLLPEQAELKFTDVFKGIPIPISNDISPEDSDATCYKGLPVSSGRAKGKVRLVSSPADAAKLEPGDIMVAAFTDIGWTPFYGIIGGLLTEVGCSLSHGAVVAREYNLPMVSGIPNAMSLLNDGDEIEIDGRKGTISVISRNSE